MKKPPHKANRIKKSGVLKIFKSHFQLNLSLNNSCRKSNYRRVLQKTESENVHNKIIRFSVSPTDSTYHAIVHL